MKIFANISRVFAGLVFLFSGFVKGVDPLGFAYKLEDYFVAFHWDFLMPFALVFAILLCTLEFTVGAMLVLNLRMKLTSWLLLLIMAFFTVLTFNDALYSPVPDCGCFGTAVILTNWQTFYKNVILMVFAIIVFLYRNKYAGYLKPGGQWIAAFAVAASFAAFSSYCYMHLPVVDFTEWKTGHKLFTENPKPVKYYLTYRNKKTGEKKEYLSPDYPFSDSTWMAGMEFVSQRVEDPNVYYGKSLVITDTAQAVVTESIIRNPGYQLVVNAYDLKKTNLPAFKKINEFSRKAYAFSVPTAVLVNATAPDIAQFSKENNLSLDFYLADDILLKTMVRSNPGIMLLKGGVIIHKWHYSDLPDFTDFSKNYLK